MTTASETDVFRVAAAGDSALVVEFPSRIDPAINSRAMALATSLEARWAAILRDIVIGYCTLTVYFDPLRIDGRWLASELESLARDTTANANGSGVLVEVPVCYDSDFGPDLQDVAAFGECSIEEAIALHGRGTYRVYMIGFIPGFAYLAEVDRRIAAPRRATPRTAVPAGSVAIAGGQTGIYPAVTPGGWNIIGRTPVKPYDATRPDPLLCRPGDTVKFVRISRAEFDRAW
jgi:inhibitor of KinA